LILHCAAAVAARERVTWLRPTPLLLFAGVVAPLPLAQPLRWSITGPRLFVEAFVISFSVIAAVWFAWIVFWLREQHW
jgi:hypothetical protein